MASVTEKMRRCIQEYRAGRRALKKQPKAAFEKPNEEWSFLYHIMGDLMFIDGDDDNAGPIADHVWRQMVIAMRGRIGAYFHHHRSTKGAEYATHKVDTAILDLRHRMQAGQIAPWQHVEFENLIIHLSQLKKEPFSTPP